MFYKLSAGYETDNRCDKCVVEMPTGTLRVDDSVSIGPAGVANCSLAFRWTSKAKTMSACDKQLQGQARKINYLSIHVDFLPALRQYNTTLDIPACEYDLFLVPKKM